MGSRSTSQHSLLFISAKRLVFLVIGSHVSKSLAVIDHSAEEVLAGGILKVSSHDACLARIPRQRICMCWVANLHVVLCRLFYLESGCVMQRSSRGSSPNVVVMLESVPQDSHAESVSVAVNKIESICSCFLFIRQNKQIYFIIQIYRFSGFKGVKVVNGLVGT